MAGSILGTLIELIVIGLLATTIGYCVLLDRRLQKLRADETAMRQTVVELGLATERAERAIDGLRAAVTEADRSLIDRMRAAERTSEDLSASVRAGGDVIERIGKIVTVARRTVAEAEARAEAADRVPIQPAPQAPAASIAPPAVPAEPALADTVAAAEAFALRTRRRTMNAAA